MLSPEMEAFFSWFQSHDGYIDTAAMGVVDFPASEGGRGAIALIDITDTHTLFTIPRTLLLTPRTSALPAHIGARAWRRTFRLHRGWAGLILCMMWEAARGAASVWEPYLRMMPTRFETPMFWSEEEVRELEGTSVVDKLGKEDAEKTYAEQVLPAIKSRPDLFAPEDIPTLYSLDVFHVMGTRIASRSFTVEKEEHDEHDGHGHEPPAAEHEHEHEQEQEQGAGNTSMGSAMDVDEPVEEGEGKEDEDQDEDEDEDEDDTTEVAMVPLADILNARYKSENVRLFYERDALKMVSTRVIKAGEQIWNTYGDPPNAELLRAYGHVDFLPLPFAQSETGTKTECAYGNPGDVLEVRADLVVQCAWDEVCARGLAGGLTMEEWEMEKRIEWWMEDVGEDVFVFEHPLADAGAGDTTASALARALTPALLGFIRLLTLPPADFTRAHAKDKLPKPPRASEIDAGTLRIVRAALTRRAGMYAGGGGGGGGGVEEDRKVLEGCSERGRRWNAVVVRMGEKRVLEGVCAVVDDALVRAEAEEAGGAGAGASASAKRRAGQEAAERGGGKRRKK